MTKNNYLHMKEQINHLVFAKGYSPTGLEKISFHVHMGTKEQDFLWDRIYFRDFLRLNPSVANEYEQLKLKLADTYKHDREAYTESKTEFISKVTNLAKEKIKKAQSFSYSINGLRQRGDGTDLRLFQFICTHKLTT